jgi:hypothetical protein
MEVTSLLDWLEQRDSLLLGGGLTRSVWLGLRAVKLRRGDVRFGSSLRASGVGEVAGKMNGVGYAEFDAAKLRRSDSMRPTSLALKGVKVGQGGNAGEVKSLSIAVEVLRLSSKMELSAVSRLNDENRIESFFDRRNRFGG